jgi:hypothetical protein
MIYAGIRNESTNMLNRWCPFYKDVLMGSRFCTTKCKWYQDGYEPNVRCNLHYPEWAELLELIKQIDDD